MGTEVQQAPCTGGVSSRGCAASVPFWGPRGMRWLYQAKREVLVCRGLARGARGRC